MRNPGMKFKRLTTAIGACLALSVTASLSADTDLIVTNDGLALSAIVGSSSEEVLSTSIRIVGPNDFVFEGRVEGDAIDWIPEDGLEDGTYTWEAWAVTVEPGAPTIEPLGFGQVTQDSAPTTYQKGEMGVQNTRQGSEGRQVQEIPIERFFNANHKRVEQASGQFRVEHGMLIEIDEQARFDQQQPLSSADSVGAIGRIASTLLDLLIPSAHAQVQSENITIQNSTPPHLRLHDTFGGNEDKWLLQGWNTNFRIVNELDGQSNTTPFRVDTGAPSSSLHIRAGSTPRIGIGTSAPTQALHLQTGGPTIRLHSTSSNASWYVNNVNQGRFEIRDSVSGGVGEFAIEEGAPEAALYVRSNGNLGLGTDVPAESIDLSNQNNPAIRFSDVNVGWRVGAFSDPAWGVRNLRDFTHPFIVHDDAPQNALRIRGAGIGMGVSSPQAALHVRRTDGTAEILIEEEQFAEVNQQLVMRMNGNTGFRLENSSNNRQWQFRTGGQGGTSSLFVINLVEQAGAEFMLDAAGNLQVKGTVSGGSSRESKTNIRSIDAQHVVESLRNLELHEWSYINSPDRLHLGPMAEDFHEVFGYGGRPDSIAPSDLASLALLSAQHLLDENQGIREQNAELRARLEQIEALLATK